MGQPTWTGDSVQQIVVQEKLRRRGTRASFEALTLMGPRIHLSGCREETMEHIFHAKFLFFCSVGKAHCDLRLGPLERHQQCRHFLLRTLSFVSLFGGLLLSSDE